MMKDLEMLRELSLAERVGRLHRLWRTVADLELAPLGLTHPRWTALWKLSQLGGHLSQKTLAEALEIELPSLMRTLGLLEEQGLIERHSCSQDKRARIVTLTPEGKALLDQIEDRIIGVRRDLLAGISQKELTQFEDIVHRISANALGKIGSQSEERE
ncbi:transcriptional regulator SlyA [Aeromonas sp. MR19]|jgi:MarR family transcriptional regulator, transcriptional regulator for hemolysin|uniref:Transcriptional regulator SlyA n=1 Tax=Aeromonas bestiarum TaxID=105751 RepID=A0ABT7PVC9_9GAMM|nr:MULTISPECIES: transcriptional regulator SlyA [Aeromonas]ATM00868.1 transcriptional regulator SlyA [Aeromonas sp. CA23]EKP0279669.1 transcriptional regulator SlyA [Aeromonas bestiarum]KFN20963.1 MarR family transcriptional regulator [Aeromonas bestiarum]MCH7346160.1 transcriptional regulator SlyA [Aeromonas sp. MR7]MCH7375864.1 transcriptional regulator SlyA [Aeromonas sp. MR19]